ncbi:MAG: T9SS type A sorting domain-containing protein, partial [Chitinophagales bacterium]
IGEWEEICFDANLPSGEDASIIAAGNVYNKVVFFMDFGAEGTGEDVTSYLDDFVLRSNSAGGEMVDVTFALNAADQSGTESVYLKGSFNEWCEDCAPMSDDDGDGIYTVTASVAKGIHEYKFVINGSEETLRATMECVKVTDEFINRFGVFTENTELAPVGFGSCYNLGDGVKMTFRLGFPEDVTPADSIYLAGGGNFDSPGGRFRMTDENGDGIYEITVERLKGFTSDYTFANGNCPGWDCKENIANQDCAVDPFNDRRLPEAVNEDIMISTCFGICSTTANCAGGRVDVGFAVDMNGYEGDFSTVHASGSFNDYCVDCDVLSDNNGDGIYTATISVPTGNMEYHYLVDGVAESFPRGSECGAVGSDSRNTFVIEDKELEAACFNSCYACGQGVKLTIRLGFPAGVEAADEVFIAGGLTFGAPGGRFYLVDDNNDGIYELELERALGFSDYYTFANGNCPGYDCKEDIEGQDCAQADNFNDRWLPELTGDTVIETCYGMCTTSTEECMGVGIDRFNVDNNLFNLVPNFTKDFTKLTFGAATAESKSVKVYDGVGRLVFATELSGNELEYSISTRSFTNGMYFVQVQVGNTLGTQKLMKH